MVDYNGQWTTRGTYTVEKKKKKSNRFEDRPYFETELIQCKKKGNRVLNENLDKIKFPFYCVYKRADEWEKPGEVVIMDRIIKHLENQDNCMSNIPPEEEITEYILFDKSGQMGKNKVGSRRSLKQLIIDYQINIVKGKLLLFQK